MKYETRTYIGPTGYNPELGYVITNEDRSIPTDLIDKYEKMGYIEPLKKEEKKLKRTINKQEEDE